VASQSKGRVCGRSLAVISGLNSAFAWTYISSEFCVLSFRDFCDEPISCPEESYRVCVSQIVVRCNDKPLDL